MQKASRGGVGPLPWSYASHAALLGSCGRRARRQGDVLGRGRGALGRLTAQAD